MITTSVSSHSSETHSSTAAESALTRTLRRWGITPSGAAAQAVINNNPTNDKQEKKDYYLLVTEAVERSFILPHTTEVAKLPPGASL